VVRIPVTPIASHARNQRRTVGSGTPIFAATVAEESAVWLARGRKCPDPEDVVIYIVRQVHGANQSADHHAVAPI
jgi:hypothetical protein